MSDRLEEIKKDWDYDRDKGRISVSTWEEKSTIHWLVSEVERLQEKVQFEQDLYIEVNEKAIEQIDSLTKELEEVKGKLLDGDTRVDLDARWTVEQLKPEIIRLEKERHGLQSINDSWKLRYEKLEAKLADKAGTVDKLAEMLREREGNMDGLVQKLRKQLYESKKKVDELEETLIKQQNHYNTHNSHYLRKIKNQRKQLKEYETCAERLRDKRIAFWTAVREALK